MLPYKHLEMFYRNGFFKKILRIEPGSHYEWDDTENGVDLSDAPTVVAVPDMSLKMLAETITPPLSRSGVNHRMTRLMELADSLKLKEETQLKPNDK